MSRNQSDLLALALRLSSAAAIVLAALGSAAAQAQTGPAVQWVQTSLTEPAFQLFTPASGALFVRTKAGLMRSADGGGSWSNVVLPPEPPVPAHGEGWPGSIVVDPTDHTTIYATSPNGIYKTDDDAVSWRVVLPPDPTAPELSALAVSPADPQLLYATLRHRGQNQLRLVRSADGGATWETIHQREVSVHVSCDWATYLLQAHPTDPDRVFLASSCLPRSATADLEQSVDRGTTWTTIYDTKLATPSRIVMAGVNPPRQLLMTLG
jgi:hypothetical protein